MKSIDYFNKKDINFKDTSGPWMQEPDKSQFVDEKTGMPCLIVRNRLGALCGYVGVSSDHPYFEIHYDDVGWLDVHGGLTFSEHCRPGDEDSAICHLVDDGEDDNIWWLGFDCAHCGDLCPAMTYRGAYTYSDDIYRDYEYVKAQIRILAEQLSQVKGAENV